MLPEQYPGDDWINVHRFMATPVKDQIDTAIKQKADVRAETKQTAELPGIKADTARKVAEQDATALEGEFVKGGPDAFKAAMGQLPYDRAKVFEGVGNIKDIRERAMTADQRTTTEQTATNAVETKHYHDAELENAAQRIGIERQRLYADKDETTLTPEALGKMAEMFATTGQLPAMGMGRAAAAVRSQIINKAASDFPAVQFATQRAAFDANKQSLKQAQTRMDQVSAAETTAGKNLDVFLDTAKKVVDSGSPWINKPLREISSQGLGSTDMAAYNAARQTAIAEISKVLNNPQGGAAVSDSARKEVEGLISPNASLNQVYAAAKILKTDMKNRHDAYQGQIDAINQRIGGATGGGASDSTGGAAKATHRFNPKTGQIEAIP